MNDYFQKQDLQAAIKPRFHGHSILKCKTDPRYPESAEREYIRMMDAFMGLVNDVMRKHMPKAIGKIRLDSSEDKEIDTAAMLSAMDAAFLAMERDLAELITKFGLRKKLESFANMNRKLTIWEWKRAIKDTLGIDINDE